MDLLLDVDIITDICAGNATYGKASAAALTKCVNYGGKLWIYTGSVLSLEYNLINELKRGFTEQNVEKTNREICYHALSLLKTFSSDKHWLAALPEEGNVFDTVDPENEQLLRALERFQPGKIKLLTRNSSLLNDHPELTVSPEQYCQQTTVNSQVSFIDIEAQQNIIRPKLEKSIHKVLHHGKYILGPEVNEFEKKLADFVGVKHCIAVSSGTDALLMALMAKGIGPGDAVFTTPFTFIATAEVISLLGATPVFVDIDPQTFNMDPNQLKKAILALSAHDPSMYPLPSNHHELTAKAIIPVDLFGLPADYNAIMGLVQEQNLFVLEDAAQGLGGVYMGRKACSLGHASATSFFPAKPLGCYGDGGAMLTDDAELAEIATSIRVHGKGVNKYDNIRLGLNARLHTLQAAILLPKLDIFPDELIAKKQIAKKYTAQIKLSAKNIKTPFIPNNYDSAWAQYSLVADGDRSRYMEALKKIGIPSMVYYHKPLHLQKAYSSLNYKSGDMPISEMISSQIFSLPMHAYLKDEEIDRIVKTLGDVT